MVENFVRQAYISPVRWNFSKRIGICLCVVALAAATAGCESARKAFGSGKNAPDEFVVYKRPPLSLPTEYGLRPPTPGKDKPLASSPTENAKAALLGRRAGAAKQPLVAGASQGLQALLRNTGATSAQADIRKVIEQETSALAKEDRLFVNKLIFWVDDPKDPATIVDAKKERQRILQNQALGKPITEGATPKIIRKQPRKGILNF